MSKQSISMSELEDEMTSVEIDSIKEEQYNADSNYAYLDKELKKVTDKMPYPDVRPYDTASDYESINTLQVQKKMNEPFWDKVNAIEPYCKNGSLYAGHVQIHNNDYYLMEGNRLETKNLGTQNKHWLVNVDDRNYKQIINDWRFPNKNSNVNLSRNIVMRNRNVKNVDVVLDKNTTLYSNITDKYLRNALIRNKNNTFSQSIIQTIQEKQNHIRELPATSSFIVQGCAGSGKTMVLLHRLRYLIYNEEIVNGKFIFLVPSIEFKTFIAKMLSDFNISSKNVMIAKEYYQSICGKNEEPVEETSELVFSQEYLKRVYSEKFLKEAYQELFDELNNQINILISLCEEKFNEQIEKETEDIKIKKKKIKQELLSRIQIVTSKVEPYINVRLSLELDNMEQFILELKNNWLNKKMEYEKITNPDFEVIIDENDDRILNDIRVRSLIKEIKEEKNIIEKATIFTVLSHKRKLKNLESKYKELHEIIVEELVELEKEKLKEKATQLQFLYDDVTMSEAEKMLNIIEPFFEEGKKCYSDLEYKSNHLEEYLGEKYQTQIENLNDLIDLSSNAEISIEDYLTHLTPAINLFEKCILGGRKLLDSCKTFIKSDNDLTTVNNDLKLLADRTSKQIQALMNVKLFSICKRKIFEKFRIKISKVYKHYWYLEAYCNYLTKERNNVAFTHIFVDEAQDFCASEIDLINKLNISKSLDTIRGTVFNLFGDVNQTITTFGIDDWDTINEIPKVYNLVENFRNTNQIVKYCNKNLSMNMTDVGVDMDEVSEYQDLEEAYRNSNNNLEKSIFIVKDDYAVQDLNEVLNKFSLKDYSIYTVKESKGLEFKEIYVFNQGMTRNEKYIAYTRALAKLNVVFMLPKSKKEHVNLIVQGDDFDDNFNAENNDSNELNQSREILDQKSGSKEVKTEIKKSIENVEENLSKKEVYYLPGQEPIHIRAFLDKLFRNLDNLYPDKKISKLNTKQKNIADNIAYIAEVLEYPNVASFLRAYGYEPLDL